MTQIVTVGQNFGVIVWVNYNLAFLPDCCKRENYALRITLPSIPSALWEQLKSTRAVTSVLASHLRHETVPWQVKATMMPDHSWQQSNQQFWYLPSQDHGPSINLQDAHSNEKAAKAETRTNAVIQNAIGVMFLRSVSA